ncbi:hypothetical protein acsn021_20500 [Anaerocolumna cellulosilytica]|uniref:Uncharacterized protein n=1 Tax=Anaerocolumna cellulosilytica TaxID=433286 RepID=A0A6S6R610_9FIRM|nr:hypothetical protein [Anaerocolumna cellulosilytica]MBB5196397.1 hypothetical protein [Anaerocolumna cellulosilytica]BCJ94481.1 hypothetical protein acsn021_20500 [Anaerocolumna cellulosilytica]
MRTFLVGNKVEQKTNQTKQNGSGINKAIKYSLDKLKEAMNPISFNSEEEKRAYEDKIIQKVNSGEKLTSQELSYLRQNNPEMYQKVVRLELKRKAVEQRLKNCKSKKEAEEVISNEISNVSDKDPDRALIIKVIENTVKEFKKSPEYQSLPIREEDEENKRKSRGTGLYNQASKNFFLDSDTENFDFKI